MAVGISVGHSKQFNGRFPSALRMNRLLLSRKGKWEKYIIDNLDILFSESLPAELWLSSLGGLSIIYRLDIAIPVFYTSFMILYVYYSL